MLHPVVLHATHALLPDLQGEGHPAVGVACQAQHPAVQLHDSPREAQPDARTVGLGRVEGGENVLGNLRRDGPAVVAELDDDVLGRVDARADFDFAIRPSGNRLAGILEQIDGNLSQLDLVGVNHRVGRFDVDPNPQGILAGRRQHLGLPDKLAYLERLALREPTARAAGCG